MGEFSEKIKKNDIAKAIAIYNNQIVFDAINKYCIENKMSEHDFFLKVKNEGFTTILKKDIPEYENGQRDITHSGAINYLITLLDLDSDSFREYKPYNFDKLYLDDMWSLEYNFNYDLDAKNFVRDFLHKKDIGLFLNKYDLKKCKIINITELRKYENLKQIDYSDIWYSFYDMDSKKYYEASPEMLNDIIELYYKNLIENYQTISGKSAKSVKDAIKQQPTSYIRIINSSEKE